MELEFKSFGKILHIGKLYMSITQKIHGSNAQVLIQKDANDEFHISYGSRNRWITPDDDNYGFARFVHDNKEEFIDKLGEGRHFGEWAGAGINSGEGLIEKTFCLFNWRRWEGKELPLRTRTVPLLYNGAISLDAITDCMERLKTEGSFLSPGFMRPEGVVIEIDGQFYKNVFDLEEVKWIEKTKRLPKADSIDISHLLQPLRLEKLLSKDEKYIRDYPSSLGNIYKDYIIDLESENQMIGSDEEIALMKKELGRRIFFFIKSIVSGLRT